MLSRLATYLSLSLFSLAQVETTAINNNQLSTFMLIIVGLFFIISALLVTTILSQTSKSEGLSGTLGGRSEATFKGKGVSKSIEDKLDQITTGLAIAFLVIATILSVVGI